MTNPLQAGSPPLLVATHDGGGLQVLEALGVLDEPIQGKGHESALGKHDAGPLCLSLSWRRPLLS